LIPYSITAYLDYRRHAKTRHGIHSPFVYEFVEKLLYKHSKKRIDILPFFNQPSIAAKYQRLLSHIVAYYQCKELCCYTNAKHFVKSGAGNSKYDLLLLNIEDEKNWQEVFENNLHLLQRDSIVAINGIHRNESCSATWQSLYGDSRVKLSMDLYGIGLLFFRDDFKEKQHFVLKY
jgi:hypothetical protein